MESRHEKLAFLLSYENNIDVDQSVYKQSVISTVIMVHVYIRYKQEMLLVNVQ